MHELTATELSKLHWCDAHFFGYYWDSGFTDPTLIIRVEPANSHLQELVCNWATELDVKVDSKNVRGTKYVGPLLTREVIFKRLPDSRWDVGFDLASHGSVEFECNKMTLRPVPITISP